MGTAQNIAAGKGNPPIDAKGGEIMTGAKELWQLMHPAAKRIKGLRRTPLGRFRVWLRYKNGEYPWFVQI